MRLLHALLNARLEQASVSANSRLYRANLTRTTWVVEMCRPGYRACAADSHDHKQDPTLMFCFSDSSGSQIAAGHEREKRRGTQIGRIPQQLLQIPSACTQSRENRGFGWTFPGRWIVGRPGWESLCCEAPAQAQVPVPVPGAGEGQKPPTAPTAPGMHR